MAFTLKQSEFIFTSLVGGKTYTYTVVLDKNNSAFVRNVQSPQGPVRDPMTTLPEAVVEDINESMDYAQSLVSQTIITSGVEAFTGQATRTVTLSAGLLNNANYRVITSTSQFIAITIENKTATSFDITACSTIGTVADPVNVSWVLVVSTAQSSALGGSLIFDHTSSSINVTFTDPFETDSYRVMLSPLDFVEARVTSQSTTGFTVEISTTLEVGQSIEVGYDVFI